MSGATARVCKFLGEISYPLYIVQYPVVYTLLGGWLSRNPDATQSQAFFVHVMCFMLSIAVAYASLRLYDEPVRRWLSTHWALAPPSCERMNVSSSSSSWLLVSTGLCSSSSESMRFPRLSGRG